MMLTYFYIKPNEPPIRINFLKVYNEISNSEAIELTKGVREKKMLHTKNWPLEWQWLSNKSDGRQKIIEW